MKHHKKTWQDENREETERRDRALDDAAVWVRGLSRDDFLHTSPDGIHLFHSSRDEARGDICSFVQYLPLAIAEVTRRRGGVRVTYDPATGFEVRPSAALDLEIIAVLERQLRTANETAAHWKHEAELARQRYDTLRAELQLLGR